MKSLVTFFFIVVSLAGFSRSIYGINGSPKRDSLRRFHNTVDTNYIRKYPDRFIVTLSQSYRQYDLQFTQTMLEDTGGIAAPKMLADANVVTGLSIDFDKISFSFGLKSTPPTSDVVHKKGNTKYSTLGLSFTFYRFRFECSYRDYHGFYDVKSPLYMPMFDSNGVYYQNPSMDVRSIRAKSLFIFNKRRFSYSAAYFNTQRQMKTAGSFLIVDNLYDFLVTADTSIVPGPTRLYYGQYGAMNYYRVQGFSIGPGYSFNLVLFHTLFFNATLTSAFDFQHRNISTYDGSYHNNYWKTGAAGDLRLALGLNGKRMFASITYRGDFNSYVNSGMHIAPGYHSVDFNFGYRFKMRRGRLYKKLNANKWYQLM